MKNNRIVFIKIFLIISFIFIILRIVYLNIYMGSYYKMKLSNENNITYYGDSTPRGRILDRNGKVLVDNKVVRSIVYKKPNNVTYLDEIKSAYKISNIIDIDYKNIKDRNKREFYILIKKNETDKLISSNEYKMFENRKLSEDDLYELKIKRIKKDKINKMSNKDLKAAYIYYLMNKGYFYSTKVIKNDVTNNEFLYFNQNKDKLNGFRGELLWDRYYPYKNKLRSILGSISSYDSGIPKEDLDKYLKDNYMLNDRVGISGLEKEYESVLKGEKDKYKILKDGKRVLISKGKKGKDIKLSLDIDLETKIDEMLEKELLKAKKEVNTDYFNKIYLVLGNPNTGEIYSINGKEIVLKKGRYKYYDIPESVFLSTITPGSVVKGASIMVGYTTRKIKIGDYVYDNCIYLYNLPPKCSWRTLGYINDLDALSMSSNVYQYKIAMKVGGFNYSPFKKLKINPNSFDIYRNMFYRYGLGVKTGLDFPKEEDGYKSTSREGDLLINYSIGQYDTYTTMQLYQYISVIANGGNRYKTRFLKEVETTKGKFKEVSPVLLNTLDVKDKYINRVRKGFRKVMTNGTGIGYIDEKYNPSGKTGTSESLVDLNNDGMMDTSSISNNFVGYMPSNKPILSIAGSFPDISSSNSNNKSYVNMRTIKNATDIFFSFYDLNGEKLKK